MSPPPRCPAPRAPGRRDDNAAPSRGAEAGRDGADSRALEITRRRRLREGEDGTAPAEQRPASGEPVRPPSDGRPSGAIG